MWAYVDLVVGLKLKTLIQCWLKDLEANKKLSGCVLGYLWDPSTDNMGIKFKFNLSKKSKGVNILPNLGLSYLDNLGKTSLSNRKMLSICNEIYDPLGMAAPYTIKFKLLVQESLLQQDRSESGQKSL